MILFDRFLSAVVDSAGAGSSGFPTGLRGPAGIHLRGPSRVLILRIFQAFRGGFRARVDSQKNRPDASEVARCAPQHTAAARRDPQNYAEPPFPAAAGGAGRPAHASREDIPFVALGAGWVNPFRCLSENCLT